MTLPNLALKQHFTDAPDINDLMCRLLGDVHGSSVLEPCVGHGSLLSGIHGASRIDAVDIDPVALSVVRNKFADAPELELHEADFIDLFVDGILGSTHPVRTRTYDAVIANPPYGLYLKLDYRKRIRRNFPDMYVRETYGLFFHFAITQLRKGGRYCFLLPDTFLSSVSHKSLRAFICAHAAPTHIVRFSSKQFGTVNFGYGNLCIIAGTHCPLTPDMTVEWIDAVGSRYSLREDLEQCTTKISGGALLNSTNGGWSTELAMPAAVANGNWTYLGEIAECRTGIYTGDNERFIGYDPIRVSRRLNGHPIAWARDVHMAMLTEDEKEAGIHGEASYVPLIRGGHREAFDETAWAVKWDEASIAFYRTNRKARLQNSKFYFRQGLSVPMVSTSRISAALMQDAVFDQGVVGVFPNALEHIPALLLYLNSQFASKTMKRIVNGSANNSANYLKKLPVPIFGEADLKRAKELIYSAKSKISLSRDVCDAFSSSVGAKLPD